MATILILGCNGQLGSEIKALSKFFSGYDFIFTDVEQLNICDREKTVSFIAQSQPDWIVNCAAYNAVDKAESEPDKARLINTIATKNIAEAIDGSSTRFIHVSTDYVFDGTHHQPYNEEDIPMPATAYGKSKRDGEIEALKHQGTTIIRTAWLYSSFGANFVKTIQKKAAETGALNVVFDQVGTPTYAADLANAIMTIISGVIKNKHPYKPGIYHYTNEGVCSWYDFAKAITELSNIECSITPVLSSSYNSIAKRPFYSVLDKTKIKETYNIDIPYWRRSLEKCINLL